MLATRDWHVDTLLWWAAIWRSPASSQWNDADRVELERVARLVDVCAQTEAADVLLRLAGELRLQCARFGLDPLSRAKLRWESPPNEPGRAAAVIPLRGESIDPRELLGRGNKGRSFKELAVS